MTRIAPRKASARRWAFVGILLVISACNAEVSPSPSSHATIPPEPSVTRQPVATRSTEPTQAVASDCGAVIAATPVHDAVRVPLAVFSSAAGLGLYDIHADTVDVLAHDTSPFGLVPRLRTPNQVSYVMQREPSDSGHLWGQDSVFEFDVGHRSATEVLRLPNHVMGYGWDPAGQRLAYQLRTESASEDGPVHLCLFDSRAGTSTLISTLHPPDGTGTGQDEETLITWSPSGDAILVVDTAEQTPIVIVDGDGHELIEPQIGTFARWLPDERLFFQKLQPTDPVADWVVLTLGKPGMSAFPLPALAFRPAVSPDGGRVAFDNGNGDQPVVYLLDLGTGTTQTLAKGYVAPVWITSTTVAASATQSCSGECSIPWITAGTTIAIDTETGKVSQISLPTTLQESRRNGTIDVQLPTAQ